MTPMIDRRTLIGMATAMPLAASSLTAPSLATQPVTAVARHGRLQVRDGRLTDQSGKPVTLRGMSLFWSQWIGKYWNEPTVRRLRDDWGITLIRAAVAVDQGGYREHPDREWAKLETVVDAAVALGLYVIVDWHAHEPHPADAAAFFARVAQRWGALPNLIYEPYNEPLQNHGWSDVLKPYHRQVLASIRAHDLRNLVVLGTRTWSQAVEEAAADPVADPNIAYTLHYYAATHKQWLRDAADRALAKGAALFVTEYGVTEASGDKSIDAAEAQAWWDWMEARGISHANWSVSDKAELCSIFTPGTTTDGRWTDANITTAGQLVRNELRRRNSAAA
ncbi:glycoside hydrolase family 5 protein [Sphingomonas sp. BGYR3]|uniref:glycoside hydrolase family 5 protein n=1 Tax=Sphingomonas sp. BGYR3 TaxID=2975483 RepID=UPI0021A4D6C6|nr:glycoside hydrolase family 5 protein [Sphingomonas sp. BGYR3]MDG5488593.1 glycoside hydrolase family 5 protein [Sphingomonas sp. BGYR3]